MRSEVLSGILFSSAALMLFLPAALSLYDIATGEEYASPFLENYIAYSAVVIALLVAGAVVDHEASNVNETAFTSVMVAFVSAARIPFAALPGIQPCTVMIFLYGHAFGPRKGAFLGAMVPLVSNMFLGQGPWTLWQMGAWATVGILGGILGRSDGSVLPGKWVMAVIMLLMGYIYGLVVDISTALFMKSYILALLSSLPFDTLHAIGNVLFYGAMGGYFHGEMLRIKRRTTVEWVE